MSLLALLEVEFVVLGKIEKLAASLAPAGTLTADGGGRSARRLAELDAISVEQWLRQRCWTSGALRLGALTVEMVLGVEPAQVSMLGLLRYVKDNGSLKFLVEVENAAQHAWVANGGVGRAAALLVEALQAEHGEGRFDARLNTAPKHGAYVSKPYAFVPGAFGTSGIFGGEGIASLIKEDAAKAAAARMAAEAKQATSRRR